MGVGVGLWGLNWARRSLIVRAVGDVVLELRKRAFRAAAEHDLSFYDQFSSGRIVSRITSDTNDFGQLVVIITDVVAQMAQAIILGVVLFRTEWRLSLLVDGIPAIYLWRGRRLPRTGSHRNQTRHESHGRCQRRHQGNHQRHFHREKFSPGRKHLQIVR